MEYLGFFSLLLFLAMELFENFLVLAKGLYFQPFLFLAKGLVSVCLLLINMYGVDLSFSSALLMPIVFCRSGSGSVRYKVFACFFPCHGQKDEISLFGFAFSASNYGTNELSFSCYTMWPTVIIQPFSCSLFPLLSFQKYLSFLFKIKKYLYLSSSIKMKKNPFPSEKKSAEEYSRFLMKNF